MQSLAQRGTGERRKRRLLSCKVSFGEINIHFFSQGFPLFFIASIVASVWSLHAVKQNYLLTLESESETCFRFRTWVNFSALTWEFIPLHYWDRSMASFDDKGMFTFFTRISDWSPRYVLRRGVGSLIACYFHLKRFPVGKINYYGCLILHRWLPQM
jgi:hypothetical protein